MSGRARALLAPDARRVLRAAGRTAVALVASRVPVSSATVGVAVAALIVPWAHATAQGGAGRSDSEPPAASARAPTTDADARAVLGMTLAASGADRDTLGLLVTLVIPGGPADRAGVDEGNRVGEIDGVSLRLDAADVGRRASQDAVMHRLSRELQAVRPGDEVRLRVFGGGRQRAVTVQAAGGAGGARIVAAPRDSVVADSAESTAVPIRPTAHVVSAKAVKPAGESEGSVTLGGVSRAVGDVQVQLRRLAQDVRPGPLLDTLVQVEQELADMRRRLDAAQAEQWRRDAGRDGAAAGEPVGRVDGSDGTDGASAAQLPGLRVTTVADEMSSYFGEGSAGGLLVLEADQSWDPLQPGDVIVRVDGGPADAARLRAALDSRRGVTVDVLRRRRSMTVTLPPRG
jgi:hypothetical protein